MGVSAVGNTTSTLPQRCPTIAKTHMYKSHTHPTLTSCCIASSCWQLKRAPLVPEKAAGEPEAATDLDHYA